MNRFASKVLIVPGLGNSGEGHWQTLWEREHNFIRIEQRDWDKPVKDDWVENIQKAVSKSDSSQVILVGHSLACATIAYWAIKYQTRIRGALLVAPSDTEADSYPSGTTGFTPIPLQKLSFPSIVVASTNDAYVTTSRAQLFANAWGSKLVLIGDKGHINVSAGFGRWDEGLALLKTLDD